MTVTVFSCMASCSVLSSSSYEHLATRRTDIGHTNEQRSDSMSPAFNDGQSLVSVTPDMDCLSTTSRPCTTVQYSSNVRTLISSTCIDRDCPRESTTVLDFSSNVCKLVTCTDTDTDCLSTTTTSSSPISAVDEVDSLSDAESLYNNQNSWCRTRNQLRCAGNDFVLPQRDVGDARRAVMAGDDPRGQKDLEYQTFDGKEIATIRMLELELLAADLSKQMSSMHRLMKLLNCERLSSSSFLFFFIIIIFFFFFLPPPSP